MSLSSDAILDYLRHYFGVTDEEIDFESFDVARPICKETISNGNGGNEPRYTCNGAFNYSESHKQVIDKMRLTCTGQLTYINGLKKIKLGAGQKNIMSKSGNGYGNSLCQKLGITGQPLKL